MSRPTQRPHPALVRLPDPRRTENGREACNAPLMAEVDWSDRTTHPVAYCSRLIKPGKPHRGKHRVEWSEERCCR